MSSNWVKLTKQLFTIRQAERADAGLILHFIHAIAAYEKLSSQVQATIDSLENSLFDEPRHVFCLLGFEDDVPVGFALYFFNYSTFVSKKGIYLEDLFVEPQFRGKGYGKALFLSLIHIAAELKCGRVEWSVLNWNQSAIDFYQRMGAEPMSEWTVYRLNEKGILQLTKD